jgi:hypothetical protein
MSQIPPVTYLQNLIRSKPGLRLIDKKKFSYIYKITNTSYNLLLTTYYFPTTFK